MIRARDKLFRPLDNAAVKVAVTSPAGQKLELVADSSQRIPGGYRALFVPREAGAYRATVTVAGADGSEVGARETGWAVEPEQSTVAIIAHHPQAVYFGMKSGFVPDEPKPDELIAGTERGGELPPDGDLGNDGTIDSEVDEPAADAASA